MALRDGVAESRRRSTIRTNTAPRVQRTSLFSARGAAWWWSPGGCGARGCRSCRPERTGWRGRARRRPACSNTRAKYPRSSPLRSTSMGVAPGSRVGVNIIASPRRDGRPAELVVEPAGPLQLARASLSYVICGLRSPTGSLQTAASCSTASNPARSATSTSTSWTSLRRTRRRRAPSRRRTWRRAPTRPRRRRAGPLGQRVPM